MTSLLPLPDLEILHEDNHLLTVNKPAGMLVQGDESGDESLLDRTREWIRIKYQKPGNVYCGLIHRLDRPASGAILFAKTDKAAGRICKQFRDHTVQKIYRVVVHGTPAKAEAQLIDFLDRDKKRRVTTISHAGNKQAKKAILSYRILRHVRDFCELEVELETGRKHQIRAQLANIGCPIVGDFKYGSKRKLAAGRAIALHAASLTVIHPTQKNELTFQAPLPAHWPLQVQP